LKQSILAILRVKSLSLKNYFRIQYYRILGLKIGKSGYLGNIVCDWPGSVKIGERFNILDNVTFWIKNPFNPENNIIIGDNVHIGRACEFNCSLRISIGNNCLIASSTIIVDINHAIKKDTLINRQPIIAEEIILEDDVWIGSGCVILKGVRLSEGCVVGAGSVVNKSIPPYEIWAGIPARKIGDRI
jgi:acetyltransferase-like isoleucine patch superfamily enzyme